MLQSIQKGTQSLPSIVASLVLSTYRNGTIWDVKKDGISIWMGPKG